MSSAKVHIVVTDHERENIVYKKAGSVEEVFRFSGYVVGNPAITANGRTEEEVVSAIRGILVNKKSGKRKIVEIDVGELVLAQDVMDS